MNKRAKTGGRPAGVPNRITSEMKEMISDLLTDEYSTFLEKLKEISDPVDYCNIYLKALSFVTPKPRSITIDDKEADRQRVSDLFPEELK